VKYALLLFLIFCAGTSAAVADERSIVTIVADVTTIDMNKRELHVFPVSDTLSEAGKHSVASSEVLVQLESSDDYFAREQDTIPPFCLAQGKRVRITGNYLTKSTFMAHSVQAVYSGNGTDKTGVRSRINRKSGRCGLHINY
jgi:hypothetical protein